MLIVEDRHRAAAVLEHLHTALEPLVARVEFLALLVVRIVPVLGDDHHAIDCQPAGAQCQRRFNVRVQLEPVAFYAIAPKVAVLRKLVEIHRGDIPPRLLPLPAPAVAKREAVEKMLGMRVRAHLRAEECEPLPPGPCLAKRNSRNRHRGRQQSAVSYKRTSIHLHDRW